MSYHLRVVIWRMFLYVENQLLATLRWLNLSDLTTVSVLDMGNLPVLSQMKGEVRIPVSLILFL